MRIISAALACLLAFGLALFSCDFGELPNGSASDSPLILTGTSGGRIITITISHTDPSKAVLTPSTGDYYEIKADSTLVSKGKLSVNGSIFIFTPSADSPGANTPFSATYSDDILVIPEIPGTGISNLAAAKDGVDIPGVLHDLTGTVTIDNTSPKVGDTLTATYSGGNGSGAATWQWLRGDTAISNSNSNTYIVAVEDEGKTLKAQVSYANQKGSVTSAATAAVPTDNRPTLTGTVIIDKHCQK